MRTRKLLFVFALLCTSSFLLSAQTLVSINNTITQDTLLTTIQKNVLIAKTVNASGQAVFSSQSGYVRILLSDDYGYDLLVYESSPLVAVNGIDNFSSMAMETVDIPSRLALTKIRVEIKKAELRNLSIDVSATNLLRTQQQAKADRITLINSNLRNQNGLWVAGETSVSEMSFEEKKGLFGGSVPDLQGIEYYVGGIFEVMDENGIQSNRTTTTSRNSTMVSLFDWRNRHGINWNTPVKSQFGATCWAFGAVASTEALVNLYYNKKLDMDLSEGYIVACGNSGNCNGGYSSSALNYIASVGVLDQECFANGDCNAVCNNKCPNPIEKILINSRTSFYPYSYANPELELKKKIISKGIICADVWAWSHTMALSGFGSIEAGDTVYSGTTSGGNTPIIISDGDNRIGKTYWIFKNSWGTSWGENGYAKVMLDITNQYIFGSILNTPITSLNYTDTDIVCADRDGDGYYYWGIGSKPTHCPLCAPDEPDGDDSNPNLGPMDEYGYCAEITPLVENITSTQTWNTNKTICRNVSIQSGAILTITATATVLPNYTITIQNGGKLILDGGIIDDGNIVVQNGSEIVITNNGKILLGSYDNLDIQLGAIMNNTYGEISIK